MTETIISPKVFEYDRRLTDWNKLIHTVDSYTLFNTNTLQQIVQWWNNYPINERKKKIYSFNNKPNTVWEILTKHKISKLEKIYGIYYTLECIAQWYNIDPNVKFAEIQKSDGEYDIAIIIDDYVIYDNDVYSILDIEQCSFLNTLSKAEFLYNKQ